MTVFVLVSVETPPNCTEVAQTPAACMGVSHMPYVCTGVTETPPDRNILEGNLSFSTEEMKGCNYQVGKRDPLGRTFKLDEPY